MSRKVFTDLHHGDLYYSLHRLFEERLGWELYRPIGWEWFNQGFWKIGDPYPNPADTAKQYLEINHATWNKEDVVDKMTYDEYVNRIHGNHRLINGVYHVFEPVHDYYQKAITLDQFASMEFDLILPTFAPHDRPYETLRNRYHPKAKIVAQMGNIHQRTHLKDVLHSVPYAPRSDQHALYYHQEIDPKIYCYTEPNPNTRNIYSMVNGLPYRHIYNQYKQSLSNIDMKAFGGGSPDGSLFGCKGVGEKMREANIGWHLKPGDGFGHTAMGWFASGRPVITKMSDIVGYGQDAPHLFEPGVTCINIENVPVQEGCRMIEYALRPENNIKLAENARKRFGEVVNYEAEAEQIKKFFANVLD